MLADGETVARTCFSVGFDSISSFTGLFRRRVGMTPAAWQRQAVAEHAEIAARPVKFVPNCFVEKRGWAK
jgi:AraC-like DNA-binding protein